MKPKIVNKNQNKAIRQVKKSDHFTFQDNFKESQDILRQNLKGKSLIKSSYMVYENNLSVSEQSKERQFIMQSSQDQPDITYRKCSIYSKKSENHFDDDLFNKPLVNMTFKSIKVEDKKKNLFWDKINAQLQENSSISESKGEDLNETFKVQHISKAQKTPKFQSSSLNSSQTSEESNDPIQYTQKSRFHQSKVSKFTHFELDETPKLAKQYKKDKNKSQRPQKDHFIDQKCLQFIKFPCQSDAKARRYPKRQSRIPPLKYWKGQRIDYDNNGYYRFKQ